MTITWEKVGKVLVGLILLMIMWFTFTSGTYYPHNSRNRVHYEEISIGGHKYIVAAGSGENSGIAIIHSAGCNCGRH